MSNNHIRNPDYFSALVEENEAAKARIRGAAPDLLAALQGLVALHTDGDGPAEEMAFQAAIGAIAKARGE